MSNYHTFFSPEFAFEAPPCAAASDDLWCINRHYRFAGGPPPPQTPRCSCCPRQPTPPRQVKALIRLRGVAWRCSERRPVVHQSALPFRWGAAAPQAPRCSCCPRQPTPRSAATRRLVLDCISVYQKNQLGEESLILGKRARGQGLGGFLIIRAVGTWGMLGGMLGV